MKGAPLHRAAFLRGLGESARRNRDPRQVKGVRRLGAARLFAVRPSDVQALRDELAVWLTERDIRERQLAEMGLPSPLPFPEVWIGLEKPMPIPRAAMPLYGVDPREPSASLYGWYLTAHRAYRLVVVDSVDADGDDTWRCQLAIAYRDGEWQIPPPEVSAPDYDPWILHAIIGIVNDSGTTLIGETGRGRRSRRRAAKATPPDYPTPRAYHAVDVVPRLAWVHAARGTVSEEAVKSWVLRHRIDVRGHHRVRVIRGELPMDPRQRADLEARGYEIADDEVDFGDELDAILRRKAIPRRRRGEWVAVLHRWIEAHQRGPEGAPHIPSTWRVRRQEDDGDAGSLRR